MDSHLFTNRLSLYLAHKNSYPAAISYPRKACSSMKSWWRNVFQNSRVFECSTPTTVVGGFRCFVLFSHQVGSDSLWPLDCSLPGSSVCGILQARILEWVAISFSRRSSQPRDRTHVSCLAGRFCTTEPPGKPNYFSTLIQILRFGQTVTFFPFSSELRSHPAILTHAYTKAECKIPKNMRSRRKHCSRF